MTSAIAGPCDFQRQFDVSRETVGRLEILHHLLIRWNSSINLISRASEDDLWRRHIVDSAQLWCLRMPGTHWIDMGAGAGFPGLVVAALAKEHEPTRTVALIESDARKAAFLTTAAHAMGVGVDVRHERVEHYTGPRAEVISARAFAPLPRLLFYAEKLRVCRGICLFPKGVSVHKEIAVANRTWRFTARMHTSITDLNAIVLEIGAFERV